MRAIICIRRLGVLLHGILISSFAASAIAAVPGETLKTDLESLIRAAAPSKVQFAVHVPHVVSSATIGQWSVANGHARWTYAVRIPTAVSMSFHAIRMELPDGATLTVRGLSTTTVYRASDIHDSELWSRIQPGESLQFTLDVAAADRSHARLEILSFQAGYRSIGAGVKDHPIYRRMLSQIASSTNTSCVDNYMCAVNGTITPAGQATVGLTIGNLYQCTGTMLNDVPGDNTPYVLTARHCESGIAGGGNPGAAGTVNVYWDATSACGAALGSLYDPGIPMQSGATTVVEQQDAWLIQLASSPVVTDAEFAGFDATGGVVQGGYTVHHALGFDKQYTGWFGQAFPIQESDVLGTTYTSNFWETVNQVGNIGPGASGSGLFDQGNHLVGSLSLGRTTTDTSGYEMCPIPNPIAPNGTNGTADFTSLAAIWSSTADATSTTGPATLKSVLDPANTGTKLVASAASVHLTFTSPITTQTEGVGVPLTWSAPTATACTAGGGAAGDGWTGTLSASGTQSVTEASAGVLTYTLACTFPGGRSAHASVQISWVGPTPTATLTSNRSSVWATRPVVLMWTSNASSCALAGGDLALMNLPGSGSTTTTQATAGDVTYTLTCGTSPSDAIVSTDVAYETPSLVFQPSGTDRLIGEPFLLAWQSDADSCIPAGGAPNDGWANTTQPRFSQPYFTPITTTPGTYTYLLTCIAGPLSVQKAVTVTLENGPPFVSTTIDKTSTVYSASPADYITYTWHSNLTNCGFNSTSYLPGIWNTQLLWNGTIDPDVSVSLAPAAPGTYVLSVTCTAALSALTSATSTPVTITVLPPPAPTATLSVSPSIVTTQQTFMIAWSSTNATSCVASGGNALSGPFVGALYAASGSMGDATPATGTYTLNVSCQSIDTNQGAASAQATVTVVSATPPTASLLASSGSVTDGSAFALTWSSTNATSCTASGGGATGSAWSGTFAPSGSVNQTATTNGKFTYSLTCTNGIAQASAQTVVTVSPPIASSTGGGGGGGGGGLGVLELALLGVLRALRHRYRNRDKWECG